MQFKDLADLLAGQGFVAAEDEAQELIAACASPSDLASMVSRRLAGEPLAWITGKVRFCDIEIRILPQVYVPRWQTEGLVRRAIEIAASVNLVADICTGSGAIARVLSLAYPNSHVVGCDSDANAIECAGLNGVEVYQGHLMEALPGSFHGRIGLVVSVPPYVPADHLRFLPSGTADYESVGAYCGGEDGLDFAKEIISQSTRFLIPGGKVLMELGHGQADALAEFAMSEGFRCEGELLDDEGDLRGIELTFRSSATKSG